MGETSARLRHGGSGVLLVGFIVGAAACGGSSDAVVTDPGPVRESQPTHTPSAAAEVAAPTIDGTADLTDTSEMANSSGAEMTGTEMTGAETTSDAKTSADIKETSDDVMSNAAMAAMAWPRPWDPAATIDFSGVSGVTVEQQQRAEDLAAQTLIDLPAFADVNEIGQLGYTSIGDADTGHEHYINTRYLFDDHELDPQYPESLVYEVDGDQRTLVSAMFMVNNKPVDDPELTEFAGPLMQWHIHSDLCWQMTPDGPQVVGTHAVDEPCPPGQFASVAGERLF